jgi:hypothetical protein
MQSIPLIIKIVGPVSEAPTPQTGPINTTPLRIDVQTTGGPAVLEISRDAAWELMATLQTHLQAHYSR